MSGRQRKSARNDIARVFAEMVARDGYSATSIADVANALGISKGTVVHHFGSKLELLERVHWDYMERRLAEGHYVIASLASPTGQLAGMIYALIKCHRDDRPATVSFLREFVRFTDEEPITAVRAQRDVYRQLVQGIVERGMQQGEFRKDDEALVTLQIFGMCNYAWTWYRPEGRFSAEDIAASATRTVLLGLNSSGDATEAAIAEAIAVVRDAPIDDLVDQQQAVGPGRLSRP